jgi:hexokinase
MKATISQQIEVVLKNVEKQFTTKSNDLQAAIDNYQILLDKGWTKKRGYSLQTIESAHLNNNRFHTQKALTIKHGSR